MWMVYKGDENYIQGTLVSKHSTEKAAMNRAKKEINFSHATEDQRTEETLIWLDNKNHMPVGVIVKKKKKKKQGPETASTG